MENASILHNNINGSIKEKTKICNIPFSKGDTPPNDYVDPNGLLVIDIACEKDSNIDDCSTPAEITPSRCLDNDSLNPHTKTNDSADDDNMLIIDINLDEEEVDNEQETSEYRADIDSGNNDAKLILPDSCVDNELLDAESVSIKSCGIEDFLQNIDNKPTPMAAKQTRPACSISDFTALSKELRSLSIESDSEACEIIHQLPWKVCGSVLWFGDYDRSVWLPIADFDSFATISLSHVSSVSVPESTLRAIYRKLMGCQQLQINPLAFEQTNPTVVNFRDVSLDIQTGEIRERTLEHHAVNCLSISTLDFDDTSQSTDLLYFFEQLCDGDNATLMRLQEACGLALSSAPARQLIYLRTDDCRSAVLLSKMLAQAVAHPFASFLSVRDLARSFRAVSTLGKQLIISACEGEVTIDDVEPLLRVISGAGINADRKYASSVDFYPSATYVCTGRKLPMLRRGCSDALGRSMLVVNLPGGAYMTPYTEQQLLRSNAAFIRWSIDGLKRLAENSFVFTAAQGCDPEEHLSSIRDFIDAYLICDSSARSSSADLYQAYLKYCEDQHVTPQPRLTLIRVIGDTFNIRPESHRFSSPNGQSTVLSGFKGIRINCDTIDGSDDSENDINREVDIRYYDDANDYDKSVDEDDEYEDDDNDDDNDDDDDTQGFRLSEYLSPGGFVYPDET